MDKKTVRGEGGGMRGPGEENERRSRDEKVRAGLGQGIGGSGKKKAGGLEGRGMIMPEYEKARG